MASINLTPDEERVLDSVVAGVAGSDRDLRVAIRDHLLLRLVMEVYVEQARRAMASRDPLRLRERLPDDMLTDFDQAATEFDRVRAERSGPLRREAERENEDVLLDTDLLSTREASLRFGIQTARLRRMLARGGIEGAHKIPGMRSGEWRIPAGSLRALGFEETPGGAESIGPVRSSIRLLERVLLRERRRGEELDQRLKWSSTRIAKLEADLRAEREERRRLESELPGRRVEEEIDLTESDIDLSESEDQDRPHS